MYDHCLHVCLLSAQAWVLPLTGSSMGTHKVLRGVNRMHFLLLLGHRSVGYLPPSSRGMIQRQRRKTKDHHPQYPEGPRVLRSPHLPLAPGSTMAMRSCWQPSLTPPSLSQKVCEENISRAESPLHDPEQVRAKPKLVPNTLFQARVPFSIWMSVKGPLAVSWFRTLLVRTPGLDLHWLWGNHSCSEILAILNLTALVGSLSRKGLMNKHSN